MTDTLKIYLHADGTWSFDDKDSASKVVGMVVGLEETQVVTLTLEPRPVEDEAPPPAPEIYIVDNPGYAGVTVRAGPGTMFTRLGLVNNGEEVTRTGPDVPDEEGNLWMPFSHPLYPNGYVARIYGGKEKLRPA